MIYFIINSNLSLIKIGISNSPYRRLRQIKAGFPIDDDLDLLLVIPGGNKSEKEIHEKYKEFHRRGEWFESNPSLIEFIEEEKKEEIAFCRVCGNMYVTSPVKDDVEQHCKNHLKIRNGAYPYRIREVMKTIAWQYLADKNTPVTVSSHILDDDDAKRLIVYAWWSREKENGIRDNDFDDYIIDFMDFLEARSSNDEIFKERVKERIEKHWRTGKYQSYN